MLSGLLSPYPSLLGSRVGLWLRSIPGNDGDVGQKEMGSAVLLLEHTGCLAAAPPALEPYHLPSVRRFSFPAWLSGQSLRAALMARLLWVLEATLCCVRGSKSLWWAVGRRLAACGREMGVLTRCNKA